MARGREPGRVVPLLLMLTSGGCAQRAAAVPVPAPSNARTSQSADVAYERKACATNATCEWPYACVEGACVLHGGAKCSYDSQCSSGQCSVGVCSIEL
ncbi:MAG: hypothetical protein WBV82_07675 [Myxococcaceae bacterium]